MDALNTAGITMRFSNIGKAMVVTLIQFLLMFLLSFLAVLGVSYAIGQLVEVEVSSGS